MKLTNTSCQNAKGKEKAYKLADGGGMFLHVMPTGGKLWRLKYRFGGREKLLSLGTYPQTTLAEARAKRDEARRLLGNGGDPSADRREKKLQASLSAENTFQTIAMEWHENGMRMSKGAGHSAMPIMSCIA